MRAKKIRKQKQFRMAEARDLSVRGSSLEKRERSEVPGRAEPPGGAAGPQVPGAHPPTEVTPPAPLGLTLR